jgi:prolipoprotein diacylglyceryltransferase
VHPVQLYEAALALALAVFLQRRFRASERIGDVISRFCLGYGSIRFTLEFFRADNMAILAGLTLSQCISLGAIAVWIVYRFYREARTPGCEAVAEVSLMP